MAIRPTTKIVRKDVPAVPVPTTVDRDQKLFLQNVRERLDKLEAAIIALQTVATGLQITLNSVSDDVDAIGGEGERIEFRESAEPNNLLVETRSPDNVIDPTLTLSSINSVERDIYIPEDINLLYSSNAGLTGDGLVTGDGYLIDVESNAQEVFIGEPAAVPRVALFFVPTTVDGETVYEMIVNTP